MAVALLEGHIQATNRKLHEWVGHMVSKRHGLRDAFEDYIRGIMEVHAARPRLQHMLLEETPLPERLHEILARAEREAIDAMAGWLRLFPEVRRKALDRSGMAWMPHRDVERCEREAQREATPGCHPCAPLVPS